MLFYFYPDIFLSLDTVKLILISISSTFPFILVNLIFILILIRNGKATNEDTFYCFSVGIFLTTLVFYIDLFVSFLLKLSFRNFIFLASGIEIGLMVLIYIAVNKLVKRPKS